MSEGTSWQTDSVVRRLPVQVVGIGVVQVLQSEALRSGYRVYNHHANRGIIYHGYVNTVTVASPDLIYPGQVLEDSGPWETIHHGEVWLISNVIDQNVYVEEVVAAKKPPGWDPVERKWYE